MLPLAAASATTPMWVAVTVASIPAVAAICAAALAARSASRARAAEREAERLRLLEQRLALRKHEVYQPIINFLGGMLDPELAASMSQEEVKTKLGDFARWVVIVGSDDSVRAFRNLMQGTFHAAPPALLLRLFADFQLAARRDMGDAETEITPVDVLGMRINDLYAAGGVLFTALSLPFGEACAAFGWSIPWESGNGS